MAAAAENGGAPKTELQELQMKANQVTDEVSWPVYPVQSSSSPPCRPPFLVSTQTMLPIPVYDQLSFYFSFFLFYNPLYIAAISSLKKKDIFHFPPKRMTFEAKLYKWTILVY